MTDRRAPYTKFETHSSYEVRFTSPSEDLEELRPKTKRIRDARSAVRGVCSEAERRFDKLLEKREPKCTRIGGCVLEGCVTLNPNFLPDLQGELDVLAVCETSEEAGLVGCALRSEDPSAFANEVIVVLEPRTPQSE